MPWAELLAALGHLGVRTLADGIRNQRVNVSDNPRRGADDPGCPACSVHRELAEAERLLAGVLRNWQGTEPAPSERRAVVLLVAQNLDEAEARLRRVERPERAVADLLGELKDCIERARSALPDRSDLDRQAWEQAHEEVSRCWEMADEFAGAWFRPQPSPPVDDRLVRRIQDLSPADRQKMLEILGE